MSSTNNLVLVIGGTGAQGRPVVKAFASDGKYTVRVLARSTTSPEALELSAIPGVAVIAGDSYDEPTLRKVFAGVSYAFINTNGFAIGEKGETYWGIRMYELAREAGVKHFIWAGLIYSSKLGNFDPKYKCGHLDGKGRVSDFLASQPTEPMKWSILTSCLYVEGLNDLLRPRLGIAKEAGTLAFVAPLGKGDLPLIYLEDYGAYARWMLVTPEKSTGLDLYVATEDIPWDQLAEDFTEVTGKKAAYVDVTLDKYFSLGIFPDPEVVIGKSAVNANDTTLMTVRENFSGFWNAWKDNLSTRDYDLLDEILPTRVKSVKEWMIKTGYTGEYAQVLKNADRTHVVE
ncbi:related to nitrogen metabolic regulation protein nmr [Rhynchosporium secalis]|uniref:Related to nitrogen metabolic regulation protein nmr n=1 Tax=Rhynchosporium secalis TaxID=38038 RepID=A0A1E1MQU7_RHYSE|nr:related to nitrogen metabolic regulation protein nmr [Rhynchosporium secalis]